MHVYRKEIGNFGKIPTPDKAELERMYAKQDSMLRAEYLHANRNNVVAKVATVPDWRPMMSPVENQGGSYGCWIFAPVAVFEGLLHSLHGSNIGINLDETEVTGYGSTGYVWTAINYIKNNKIAGENGVNSFPNYDYACYTIASFDSVTGISQIKSALNNSPVTANVDIYTDWDDFFTGPNKTGVYSPSPGSNNSPGDHVITIVSYNDADSCWICKDSRGTSFGDNGYIKVHYGVCLIESWKNYTATVSESCFAKITPGLISTLNTALGYSFADDEWAYINSDHSLSTSASLPSGKTLSSYGNIIIPSGKTLTISSNSVVKMANSKEIDVSGTLIGNSSSQFTKFSDGTYWSGIDINSGGVFDIDGNITIEYANSGIDLYNTNGIDKANNIKVTIQHTQQCGLYIHDCSPTIRNFLCDDNSNSTGYGGFEVDSSSGNPIFSFSTAQNSDCYGVKMCGSSSDANFDDCIVNNNYSHCVNILSGCSIDLDGNNNIVKTGSNKAINNPSSGNIDAEYNWWGATPASGLFAYPALVDYDPYRDAWINNIGASKIAGELAGNIFDEAFDFEEKGDINGALAIYRDIVARDRDEIRKRQAIKHIYRVDETYRLGYADLRTLIGQEIATSRGLYRASLEYILADILLKEGKTQESLEAFLSKAETYKGTSMEVSMIAKAAIICGDYLNDTVKAKEYADRAASLNPGQDVLRIAYAAADIEYEPHRYTDGFAGVDQNYDLHPVPEKPVAEELTDFVTASPNPFNPITTIVYGLSKPAHVRLDVYSVTGQKVASLVDSRKEAGHHSVVFDGSNYASGVYFYRFTAGGFDKKGRMVLVK